MSRGWSAAVRARRGGAGRGRHQDGDKRTGGESRRVGGGVQEQEEQEDAGMEEGQQQGAAGSGSQEQAVRSRQRAAGAGAFGAARGRWAGREVGGLCGRRPMEASARQLVAER